MMVSHGIGMQHDSGDRQYQGESTLDIGAQAQASGKCMMGLGQQAWVGHHHGVMYVQQGWEQAAVQEYQSLAEGQEFDDHMHAADEQMAMSSEVVQCAPFPSPHACYVQVSEVLDEPQGSED
jgi:hypothetical protein